MKKISIILVISMILVLLMSACGGKTEPAPDTTDKASVTNEEAQDPEKTDEADKAEDKTGNAEDKSDNTEKAPVETKDINKAEPEPPSDTTYTVESVGEDDKNANGEVIGVCHFQKLVFTNPNAALKKINEKIASECDKFFSEGSGKMYKDYLSNLSDSEKEGLVSYPYTAVFDVGSVFIDDKYVSIQYIWDWYAGGVRNFGGLGYTFDIRTGKEIGFADLFASKEAAAKAFSDTLSGLIKDNPDVFFENAADTVANYSMDEVKFSLDEKDITVYIDQYELAPGAIGSFTVTIAR